MKSLDFYHKVLAWSYFTLSIILVILSVFTYVVDPYTMEGGGKGGFYIAIVAAFGILIEPLFGRFSTPVLFMILALIPLYGWFRIIFGKNDGTNKRQI